MRKTPQAIASAIDIQGLLPRHPTPGLAKYAQLADALRRAIRRGGMTPGLQLPTEQQLAALSPFSLGTVQHALRNLVAEGLLVRRQGHGTFVADQRPSMFNPWHCQFLSDDGQTVLPICPQTLDRRIVFDEGPWSRWLGPVASGYLMIERRIDIAGEFAVASRFYADRDRLAVLLTIPLRKLDGENLKLIISERADFAITHVEHRLSQIPIPPDVALQIGVKRGTVGQQLDAVAFNRGVVIYFQRFYIPPNSRALLFQDRSTG